MLTKKLLIKISLIFFLIFLFYFHADAYKILVVMSYEKYYPWCVGIAKGINDILEDNNEITYFYMNTKSDFNGGVAKAKEAFDLYNKGYF